jgi:single-strand DNA-binding protein
MNKAILIGNLTRDPELRYTPEGTAVCTFGIATNRTWMTNDGQKKEDVQYHRIVAWQKLAELCAKILTKGSKVYLEGRIVYRTFTGKDGLERNVTEIIMDDFISCDSRKKEEVREDIKEEDNEEKVQTKDNVSSENKEKAKPTVKSETETPMTEASVVNEDIQDVNPDDIPF